MAVKAIVFDCYGVLYDDHSGQYNQALIAIIRRLKVNYKVGVLSNMSGQGLQSHIGRGGMQGLFDAALASGDTDYIKPQREIFEHIASMLGVQLEEMLFFDDSPDHVGGAAAHGIQAVQYRAPQDVTGALAAHHLNYL